MENQKVIDVEKVEKKYDNIGIGENVPQIVAKPVLIQDYRIDTIKKDGKDVGDKLTLITKHPDVSDRTIDISSVKYQNGDKLKFSGIWIKLDKNGKLGYNSAVSHLLRSQSVNFIVNLIGKTIPTVVDEAGYLALKAY